MTTRGIHRVRHRRLIGLVFLGIASMGGAPAANAYTPESERVQKLVARAASFLEDTFNNRLGEECLVALALYKAGKSPEHPVIKKALERCHRECKPEDIPKIGGEAAYAYSLAAIFLCEVSPYEHRTEIETIIAATVESQQEGGGWGYPSRRKGDTSQAQYCALSLWTARKVGISVPDSAFVKCANWILRSQSPTGYWGYQTEDSGVVGKRVKQNDRGHNKTFHSTTAAALGTAYICAEALEIKGLGDRGATIIDKIPSSLKLVEDDRGSGRSSINHTFLNRALADGNAWFDQKFVINPEPAFPHYYRYAFERYRSFREKVERQIQPDNSWYDEGVEFLEGVQSENGGFLDGEAKHLSNLLGPNITTSFAILFLTRGTQQSLGKLTQGSLKGQKGLPSNATDIRMRNGRITTTPISRSVGDLLGMLEGPEGQDELNELLNSELKLSFDKNSTSRAMNAARLRTLVSHRSHKARLLAVQTMARMRDIDSVPALIYSLSDPDWRVVLAANDALRYMTRQFDGYDLPTDKADRVLANELAKKWRSWYKSIKPEAQIDLAQ